MERTGRARARGSLSQEEIVTVALEIAETEGPDAVTFRRLGSALGVAPTAVLRHFRDKDDLLLALGARLLEDAISQVDVDEPDWRTRLLTLCRATRRSFEAHPRVAVLVATRTLRREAEFQAADLVIGAVEQAGLRGREAARIYRVLADTALAWTAFLAASRAVDTDAMERDGLAWTREYLVLPAGRFPHIQDVAGHLAEVNQEDQFELALELIFDAVAARGAAAAARSERC
ncbi:TetR/AcrR family transcriptional regulator [Actinoplanes subtropicus]|uniref:TetR/AcrR family transcriptional regulator n=1 Tax=Actinoplanes subtropicus TaxID=543632 RepID=UPI00055907C6|nr:TetR/AcrR family transcriptional regulator [Actinoplanes subtropicus]